LKGVFVPQRGSGYPLFCGRKGVISMGDQDTIFILTKEDVMECARTNGIPKEAITDDVLRQVRKGLDSGLECWFEVVMAAINFALKS